MIVQALNLPLLLGLLFEADNDLFLEDSEEDEDDLDLDLLD